MMIFNRTDALVFACQCRYCRYRAPVSPLLPLFYDKTSLSNIYRRVDDTLCLEKRA